MNQDQRNFPLPAGDLNIYHARLIADQQVTYILDFSGRLDLECLQAGLTVLFAAMPLLSCKVAIQGMRFQWRLAADTTPALSVSNSPGDPEDETLHFINTPSDPERQLPLKVLIIRTQTGDRLCFKIDHVLSDAGGLKLLLYLLARAYSQGKIVQPINPDRGFWQVFRKFSPVALVNAARGASVPRPGAALIAGSFDRQPCFIEHTCLDPQAFDIIHQKAKKSGTTINDILLAATFQAAFGCLQEKAYQPYPVMVPVDMRRYLPEEKRWVIGNLSSAIYPHLAQIPGESFPDLLLRVKASMNVFKEAAPGLSAALLMTLGAVGGGRLLRDRYQQAAARGSRFINLTNFGIIDEAQCRFGDLQPLQAYGVGPIQYAPGLLIALSTYRNTLHFVVQGNDRQKFQPFVHEFLETLINTLE